MGFCVGFFSLACFRSHPCCSVWSGLLSCLLPEHSITWMDHAYLLHHVGICVVLLSGHNAQCGCEHSCARFGGDVTFPFSWVCLCGWGLLGHVVPAFNLLKTCPTGTHFTSHQRCKAVLVSPYPPRIWYCLIFYLSHPRRSVVVAPLWFWFAFRSWFTVPSIFLWA